MAKTPVADRASPTLWEEAASYADSGESDRPRRERLAAIRAGRQVAERCVAQHPTMAACYYYRAVLTGLHYQLTVIGYQKGLARMLADCQRVVTLEPAFAEAGAYRIMGQIYTQIPETAFRPGSLTRDLDRAIGYLQQAVALAPEAFENHLALCEAQVAAAAWQDGARSCAMAARLVRHKRGAAQYAEWREALRVLKKRLAKRNQ
ncbi:MAG: hypothetical protein HYV02_02730 [Deltaproteobacteria bacterium]|nr:hypothetical protein [Deltaproteobacteria bacterium]